MDEFFALAIGAALAASTIVKAVVDGVVRPVFDAQAWDVRYLPIAALLVGVLVAMLAHAGMGLPWVLADIATSATIGLAAGLLAIGVTELHSKVRERKGG